MTSLSDSLLAHALDTVEDASLITDANQLIVYANLAFTSITGYSESEVIGTNCRFLQHENTDPVTVAAIGRALGAGKVYSGAILNRKIDGAAFWNQLTISPMRDDSGEITHFVSVQRDISDEVTHARDELVDAVTGLPNSVALSQRLSESIAHDPLDQVFLGIIDVDYFAQMSDSIGADAGNELLTQIAGRLSEVCDPSDFVARIGGDVFAVIFGDKSASGGTYAERLTRARAAVESDFGASQRLIAVTATAALVTYPGDGGDELALLRTADVLLRSRKYAKPDVLSWWKQTPRGEFGQVPGSFAALAPDYHAQFSGGGLTIFVQPIVELATGEVPLVESLARLIMPNGDVVDAGDFVPLLDRSELEHLFVFALDESLKQLRQWSAAGLEVDISVNLDPLALMNPLCAEWVRSALARYDVHPQRLVLELLETRTIDSDNQRSAIDELRLLGVRLAIDDLGSGHSNLARISDTDFDLIKVDRGITEGFRSRPTETLSVLWALTELSENLGRDAVVEGLETIAMVEVASTLGARFGQGYYFARPMPFGDFSEWVTSRHRESGLTTTTPEGALAYQWRHGRAGSHPGALADCALTPALTDDDARAWHESQHDARPSSQGDAAKLTSRLTDLVINFP